MHFRIKKNGTRCQCPPLCWKLISGACVSASFLKELMSVPSCCTSTGLFADILATMQGSEGGKDLECPPNNPACLFSGQQEERVLRGRCGSLCWRPRPLPPGHALLSELVRLGRVRLSLRVCVCVWKWGWKAGCRE